jgi:hypothetical protein
MVMITSLPGSVKRMTETLDGKRTSRIRIKRPSWMKRI